MKVFLFDCICVWIYHADINAFMIVNFVLIMGIITLFFPEKAISECSQFRIFLCSRCDIMKA